MAGAICALLILWYQAPDVASEPSKLVAMLGSMKYADRQAAAQVLERLGRQALPALRLARNSKDLEIRTRTVALLRKIEGAMLTEPTLLKLDFQDTPLTDVVKSLSEQSGIKISLFPDTLPRWKTQKVTLRVAEPVSFWKGIDLLCGVTQLGPNPGMVVASSGREPTFALVAGNSQPILPSWDHGPFRVNLTRLHSERDISFGAVAPGFPRPVMNRSTPVEPATNPAGSSPKPTPILNVQFNVQLQVCVEPRLSMTQNGNVQVIEAIDNLGNSLIGSSGSESPLMANRFSRHFGGMAGQQLQLVIPLKRPESPGSTIKILKGMVPILVASRRPDPLIVLLSDATGKSFENGETSVVVHGMRKNPGQPQTTIELTIRPVSDAVPIFQAEPNAISDASTARPDASQQQIEVVDGRGRILPWFQNVIDPDSSRMTMTLNQFGAGVEPKEIRIYSLTKAISNVPFEFRDILMP